MGYWQDAFSHYTYRRLPPVYSRDFAYANSVTVVLRMARGNIAESTARSFAELLSGPTVDFYVGPERRQWSIHRNLLCHHSTYFEAEFLGNEVPKAAKKSGEQSLDLPDEDPAGFELLVKWLYQGRLEDMSGMSDERKYDYSVACHKLYMLCERFDLPLKNEAIDRYRQGLLEAQLVPDAEEINEIYSRSPHGSPFRKLMTQIAARQIMDPDSDKDAESYRKCFENNPDFAVDMVNAIKAGTGGVLFGDPTDGNQCDYHDHSDGQNCHVKGKDDLDAPPSPVKSPSKSPIRSPNPLPRFLSRRTKSTESAPAISYRMDPPEFELMEQGQLSPTRDRRSNLRLTVPTYFDIRRTSTTSTGTEASDHSEADTNLSGETLFSPPLSPPELLANVFLTDAAPQTAQRALETAQQAEAGVEPVQAVERAQIRRRENNPLSYVDALRAKIHLDEDKGAYEGKSRGLWDYWRGEA